LRRAASPLRVGTSMRRKATWLILIAVGAVVTTGVVDSVRGSSSNPEAARAGESVVEPSTTTALPVQTATEPVVTTEPAAIAEPAGATVTAIEVGGARALAFV
jgi:hypothetical protein